MSKIENIIEKYNVLEYDKENNEKNNDVSTDLESKNKSGMLFAHKHHESTNSNLLKEALNHNDMTKVETKTQNQTVKNKGKRPKP